VCVNSTGSHAIVLLGALVAHKRASPTKKLLFDLSVAAQGARGGKRWRLGLVRVPVGGGALGQ
jgi:hypothetical protein